MTTEENYIRTAELLLDAAKELEKDDPTPVRIRKLRMKGFQRVLQELETYMENRYPSDVVYRACKIKVGFIKKADSDLMLDEIFEQKRKRYEYRGQKPRTFFYNPYEEMLAIFDRLENKTLTIYDAERANILEQIYLDEMEDDE